MHGESGQWCEVQVPALSYMELEKGKYKEIVRFYVSDDQNHVPIRLDLFLRFGSAKAFLNSMKEVRSPMQSVVR